MKVEFEITPQKLFAGLPRFAWWMYLLFASAMCGATLLGFLGRFWWLFDLASHFRVQYAVTIAPAVIGLLIQRRYLWSLLPAAFFAANLALIVPLYMGGDDTTGPRDLRLLICNVHTANWQHQRVIDLIEAEDPDVILLVEVSDAWLQSLEAIEPEYPYSLADPQEHNFGIAVYSRIPEFNARLEIPNIIATLKVKEKRLTLIGSHVIPPMRSARFRERNRQLLAAAEIARDAPGPCILAGDFNATSWSCIFDDVLDVSGLRDSRHGFGVQASWPTFMPPATIPIDHCLVSKGIRVLDRRIGSYVGSDHQPVIVDVAIE